MGGTRKRVMAEMSAGGHSHGGARAGAGRKKRETATRGNILMENWAWAWLDRQEESRGGTMEVMIWGMMSEEERAAASAGMSESERSRVTAAVDQARVNRILAREDREGARIIENALQTNSVLVDALTAIARLSEETEGSRDHQMLRCVDIAITALGKIR